jgi:hypothetical protein
MNGQSLAERMVFAQPLPKQPEKHNDTTTKSSLE